MKLKSCKVDLVANTVKQLGNWIEAIDEQFDNVTNSSIREVNFSDGLDYRCSVYFSAEKSKTEIYKIMNTIKANPITFL